MFLACFWYVFLFFFSFLEHAMSQAPELLTDQSYGKEVDWWSFGILLYEMLSGRTPFKHPSRYLMFENIQHQELTFPSYFSGASRDIIQKLLIRDPSKRLGEGRQGTRTLLAHPFFASMEWTPLLLELELKLERPRMNSPEMTLFRNEMEKNENEEEIDEEIDENEEEEEDIDDGLSFEF